MSHATPALHNASTATKELDDLMASLSDFKVSFNLLKHVEHLELLYSWNTAKNELSNLRMFSLLNECFA